MINETINGTFSVTGSRTGKKGFPDTADDYSYEDYPFITRPADWDSDNDGLPNWWETIIGTNLNSPAGDFSDSNADNNSDGYTNLDYYLHWMSQSHFSTETGDMISINLQELSRGFTSSPSYQISNVVNGSTNLSSNILEFTPTANGFGSFDFTVTDSEGDSMTRTVNILNGYDLSLSVEENKKVADVKVWPIPNKGNFSIKMKDGANKSEFKIFDMLGKEISNGTIEGGNAQVSIRAGGVFILKVIDSSTKQTVHTQKIIVQ